ncbi:arpin-like [Haliotis rufescens]|uniref:arpin-like n=1 Tax=Haliotis rufescens TaxID=6454 RepID=UPI001EAF8E3D|nr:arpin-like [Haliotis rufescens]
MSRIYHNQPLANLPVDSVSVKTTWDSVLECTKEGPGVILEGVIKGKARYCVTDKDNKKVRYYIFQVQTQRAHRRKFDSSGKEIEPNFSETTKISKGYLNSSYKTEAKGSTDKLTDQELSALVSQSELTSLGKKHGLPGCVTLWVEEAKLDKMELDTDDSVRVKTRGNSPFVLSIGKVENESATVSNYAGGEAVGASWTDKIMTIKSAASETTPQDSEIADDEWDD